MASFEEIAKQFIQTYYTTFDTNRPALSALFQPQSMLSMLDKEFQGPQQVLEKLQSLGGKTQHQIECYDCQPTAQGGILIVVTGKISIDDAPPMNFNETFQLFPAGSQWCILNDIFSLNLS